MILNTDDGNTQVDILNANFIDCFNECAPPPLVTREIKRPSAPWMNNSIREAVNIRNTTRVKLKSDRHNADLQEQYKQEKKRVKTLTAECKARYYHNEFLNNKGNISKTWKTIREIVPNSKNISNNSNFDNVVDKANEFNSYFANVGKNTYTKTQEIIQRENVSYPICENVTSGICGEGNTLRPQAVDTDTVVLTIKDLNVTGSVGSDGIPMKFIKDALCIIAFYITFIINTSMVTGVFPTAWKHALVISFFKSGDISDPSSFRPISLLPIVSKVLEKIVANQLI